MAVVAVGDFDQGRRRGADQEAFRSLPPATPRRAEPYACPMHRRPFAIATDISDDDERRGATSCRRASNGTVGVYRRTLVERLFAR